MTAPQRQVIEQFLHGDSPDDIPQASNMTVESLEPPSGEAALVSWLGSERTSQFRMAPAAICVRHEDGRLLYCDNRRNGDRRHRVKFRGIARRFYNTFDINLDVEDAICTTGHERGIALEFSSGRIRVYENPEDGFGLSMINDPFDFNNWYADE